MIRHFSSLTRCFVVKQSLKNKRWYNSNEGEVFPGVHRTGITAKLWQNRMQYKGEHKHEETTDLPFLVKKTPSESREEILMPFSTDLHLRDQYISPFGHLRMGKLLEDLDAMAGNVAFKHADDNNPKTRPLTIVTASVDRIQLLHQLYPNRDLTMRGAVTHVGKSSMEIQIDVFSKNPDTEKQQKMIEALFSMVARGPTGKAAEVPESTEEHQKFSQGEINKQRRLERRQMSLTNQAPTPDERLIIHELFMSKDNTNCIPMDSTHHETMILAQPTERNIHNKIFGGYLMRLGFELSFSTSYIFAKSQPFFVALDDITFLKPVEIGDILKLKSTVVYTKDKFIVVEVVASVTNPEEGKSAITNVFYFTFHCPLLNDIKRVKPHTYAEAMKFLEGKRIFDSREITPIDRDLAEIEHQRRKKKSPQV